MDPFLPRRVWRCKGKASFLTFWHNVVIITRVIWLIIDCLAQGAHHDALHTTIDVLHINDIPMIAHVSKSSFHPETTSDLPIAVFLLSKVVKLLQMGPPVLLISESDKMQSDLT